ncbi:hypothetical protein JCM10295v2_002055 [Rhodotorula toruloides]
MADAGIPAAQMTALRQLALVRAHAAVLVLVFQSIFYGIFVALAWEYYRRFRRRDGERLFLQVFMAVLLVLSTAFLALCAAVVYQYGSQLVLNGGLLSLEPTIAQTVQPFLLAIVRTLPFVNRKPVLMDFLHQFSTVAEVYWVYRAVQVAQNWISRIIAAGLWILSLAAFSGHCSVVTLIYLLIGTWLFLADSFFCAGVLVYELVYKRRNELVKSSLVQQFTALALKTSLAIVIFVLIGAIATTHAFVYGSLVSGQLALSMANLFSFASSCCVAISLLQRSSLRNQYSYNTSLDVGSNFGAHSYAYPPISFGRQRPLSTSFGRNDFAQEGNSRLSSGSEAEKQSARAEGAQSAEKDGQRLSAGHDSTAASARHVWLPRRVATMDNVERQQAERRLNPLDRVIRSKSAASLRRGGAGTPTGVTVNVEVERSVDDGEDGRYVAEGSRGLL